MKKMIQKNDTVELLEDRDSVYGHLYGREGERGEVKNVFHQAPKWNGWTRVWVKFEDSKELHLSENVLRKVPELEIKIDEVLDE